ncbi:alkaline phosphatase family protein [Citricoccus sp. SGAir0253]|uniref:alkaline phosphatase family protein n=1 Tax=Citricoccus sp. SGAir0253 TaxID=2567881 RepID=UPI0010CCC4BB|nr:alkaline phosphatase family protein [Citricoccus sp. SGAir0253]QCU78208.1 alkaline phosphatase family protein [Citricoccus sp. SGAir0253]
MSPERGAGAAPHRPSAPGTSRRSFLRAAGATGAGVLLSAAASAGWGGTAASAAGRTRVHVLVVDGCGPDEITATGTPRLAALRDAGTWFPQARSLPVMETIPNHVMMMTGARPDRTGVPANAVFDRALGEVRTLDRATDLRFPTLLERVRERGLTSASVLSKEYLYGVFGDRATFRWEPEPIVPVSGHAPDASTMDALLAMVDAADPDLCFTNLGDIDRMGHSDLTGTTLRAARGAALLSTDRQVGRLVDHLVGRGLWESTVLVVLADHSMDWSYAWKTVSATEVLAADPELVEHLAVAQNGGADLFSWTGPDVGRSAALERAAALLRAHPGVLSVHAPAELRLGAEAGDLVAYCRAGWRFTDPTVVSNPIPGNHGHPATEPIPFMVTGGSPLVRRGHVSSEPVRTVDVAPTVGSLLGLGAPAGGYDGTARTAAFVG